MRRLLIPLVVACFLLAPSALACYSCELDMTAPGCRCAYTYSGERGATQCGCFCDQMENHICYVYQCQMQGSCWWFGSVNTIKGLGDQATQAQYAVVSEKFLSPAARASVEARIAEATANLPQMQADMIAVTLYKDAFRDELINLRPRKRHPRNSLGQSAALFQLRTDRRL